MRGGEEIIKQLRINERIRASEVRLIGENGEHLGTVPLSQALQMAKERSADLVEVAPTAVPVVCRLLDYGKFKYEQAKKERKTRQHQKSVALREVRFRPKIDEHDIEFKTRLIKKLLEEGDKVKVSVLFRGREITHSDIGLRLLEKVSKMLDETAIIEKSAAVEGRRMIMILSPAKQAKGPQDKKES